jgi:hypothetical protein
VSQFIANRINGVFQVAYSKHYAAFVETYNGGVTPGHFLASPALWGGLLFAALAIILIIRLRRSNDPI